MKEESKTCPSVFKTNELQHGVNIIRMSDGTTKKVIVKWALNGEARRFYSQTGYGAFNPIVSTYHKHNPRIFEDAGIMFIVNKKETEIVHIFDSLFIWKISR